MVMGGPCLRSYLRVLARWLQADHRLQGYFQVTQAPGASVPITAQLQYTGSANVRRLVHGDRLNSWPIGTFPTVSNTGPIENDKRLTPNLLELLPSSILHLKWCLVVCFQASRLNA
jgi:hypothetical protein